MNYVNENDPKYQTINFESLQYDDFENVLVFLLFHIQQLLNTQFSILKNCSKPKLYEAYRRHNKGKQMKPYSKKIIQHEFVNGE